MTRVPFSVHDVIIPEPLVGIISPLRDGCLTGTKILWPYLLSHTVHRVALTLRVADTLLVSAATTITTGMLFWTCAKTTPEEDMSRTTPTPVT